jgi:V/A-type H+-transporting ATPase subunit C
MSKPARLDYAYSVGRVRALERFLIRQAVFREAAEAADAAAALKLVYDAGRYPEGLVRVRDSDELEALLDGEEEALKREMAELILEKKVLDAYRLSFDPDKALAAAAESGYPFLEEHIRMGIDLGNIKVFLRAKYLGLSKEKLEARLVEGGSVGKRSLVDLFPLALAEIAGALPSSAYRELWEEGIKVLAERETFVPLEKGIEDCLMKGLRRARSIVFGPEPVYAYGLAKQKEIALVRLVGVGRMLSLPAELLRERISETYV